MGLREVEMDGNSRKPEKKRMKKRKPNMRTMVEELVNLRDSKSMIRGVAEGWQAIGSSFFLSLSKK